MAVTLAIVTPASIAAPQAKDNSAKPAAVTTAAIDTGYPDVPGLHWAANAVGYLARNGYMEGYTDGSFGGDKPLTRYEFALSQSRIHIDRMVPGADERARQKQILERLTALENRFKVLEDKLKAALTPATQTAVQAVSTPAVIDRSVRDEFKSLHSDLKALSELQLAQ